MSYTAPPNWIGPRPLSNTAPGYPPSAGYPHVSNGERTGHKAPPAWAHPPPPGTAVPVYGTWTAPGYQQWPTKPPPKSGSAEYWATELKDNSLQLQGIEPTKQAPRPSNVENTEKSSQARHRSSSTSAYSRESRHDENRPPNATWNPAMQDERRHNVRRDSSQPPVQELRHRQADRPTPSPSRAHRHSRETEPQYLDRDQGSKLAAPPYPHSRPQSREPAETSRLSSGSRRGSEDLRVYSRQAQEYAFRSDSVQRARPSQQSSASPYSNHRHSGDSGEAAAPVSSSYPTKYMQNTASSPYKHSETHGMSGSRSYTADHPQSNRRSPPDILSSSTQGLQRAQTMPVQLAAPQPQQASTSGYVSHRELRTTFSPDIVRTPLHYEHNESRPQRYDEDRISPEEEEEAFWRDERVVGRRMSKRSTKDKEKEREKDKYRSSNKIKDRSKDVSVRKEFDVHQHDTPARSLVVSNSFSTAPSKFQTSVPSGLSRHSSMPVGVQTVDPTFNNLNFITEEPGSMLSPLLLGDAGLPDSPECVTVPPDIQSRQKEIARRDNHHRTALQASPLYISSSSSSGASPSPRNSLTHGAYNSSSSSSRGTDLSPYQSSSSRRPSPAVHPPCPPLTPPEANHPPCPPLTPSPKRHTYPLPAPSPSHPSRGHTYPTQSPHVPLDGHIHGTVSAASSFSHRLQTSSSPAHYGTPSRPQTIHTPDSQFSQPTSNGNGATVPLVHSYTPVSTPARSQSMTHTSLSRSGSRSIQNSTPKSRNVRVGFWNRRGDHLTPEQYLVYCPPARTYPKELDEYPEEGYMDHTGRTINISPTRRLKELPESIAHGGKPPEKPYDTFIQYKLISSSK